MGTRITCYFEDQNFAMVMKKGGLQNSEMEALLDIFTAISGR